MTAYRTELEHAYWDAHPTMKALLAMLDLSRRQAVGDRDPIRHWYKGRVVLLGDAAHPTLQSLAQGACMAIADGRCLADCIAAHQRLLRSGLPAVRSVRVARTARVTLESDNVQNLSHFQG